MTRKLLPVLVALVPMALSGTPAAVAAGECTTAVPCLAVGFSSGALPGPVAGIPPGTPTVYVWLGTYPGSAPPICQGQACVPNPVCPDGKTCVDSRILWQETNGRPGLQRFRVGGIPPDTVLILP